MKTPSLFRRFVSGLLAVCKVLAGPAVTFAFLLGVGSGVAALTPWLGFVVGLVVAAAWICSLLSTARLFSASSS